MRCKKILIIPDRAELSSYTKLADRLNLGFEYNDFFIPKLLDDTEQLDAVIADLRQILFTANTYDSASGAHDAAEKALEEWNA